MANNRVIGNKGKLPWRIPEEMKFFKATTTNNTVLMGRNTFESIGRPLPNRLNIVLSKTMPEQKGVIVMRDIEQVFDFPLIMGTIFLIGGAQMYESLLDRCDGAYLSHIAGEYEGDTFFPELGKDFGPGRVVQTSNQFEVRYYKRWAVVTPNVFDPTTGAAYY